jgi:hypothetical protein
MVLVGGEEFPILEIRRLEIHPGQSAEQSAQAVSSA